MVTMFNSVIVSLVCLLTIGSVLIGAYSVDSDDKWMIADKPLSNGDFPSNDVVEDLNDGFERMSTTDGLYKGFAGSLTETWNSCPEDEELLRNASVACHGVKILKRVVTQLLDSPRNFQLAGGVQLVRSSSGAGKEPRSMQEGDNSLISRFKKFLRSYELRIKIADMLPSGEDLAKFIQEMKSADIDSDSSARKKDKGQGGMLLAMGLMMKGMLTAIGMGGLGLLAMKALMVSGMALMLSAIIGIKKLASKDDDHGSGHVVSVVPVHHSGGEHGHYRKKRSTEGDVYEAAMMAYRGYKLLFNEAT
ncbi:hypothetical protein L9F63_006350 [Diploptera punctata]|uniref:Uncharacterized protein n=1 Tax=Diploptera punctata TaxID=6984 RepID=A0AAD7ZAG0_DIPPU|nr:hypothetical protein L9F63_006350 [Diploptera punctata]